MNVAIKVSEILEKYLPPDGEGTPREKLRMNLHREISILVIQNGCPHILVKWDKERGEMVCIKCGLGTKY